MRAWRLRSAGSWTAAPTAAVYAFLRASPATVLMAIAWTSPACPALVRKGKEEREGENKGELDKRVLRNFQERTSLQTWARPS